MNIIRKLSVKCGLLSLLPAALMVSMDATAKEETMECTLYFPSSVNSESLSSIELKDANLVLDSARHAAVCVFEDGKVADKQFVEVSRSVVDGSTGSYRGYSVYTLENGDSIFAEYSGNWGSEGSKGSYNILGGTGSYDGATGDGTINLAQSPWPTTNIVSIVLNVITP